MRRGPGPPRGDRRGDRRPSVRRHGGTRPSGADLHRRPGAGRRRRVLIQENAERHDGGEIAALETVRPASTSARAGFDFEEGQVLLTAGRRLDFRALSLAAAMNHRWCRSCGDRRSRSCRPAANWCRPAPSPDRTRSSPRTNLGIAALVTANGGITLPLGIAEDDLGTIAARIREAIESEADVLVTLGGASVGDHDLVAAALKSENVKLDFWKIAMRPGKPMMFGTSAPAGAGPAGQSGLEPDRRLPVSRPPRRGARRARRDRSGG